MSSDQSITAILVDDETLGRDLVKHMLKKHPDILILSECASAKAAQEAIKRIKPDVAFLDVQMPDGDGFAVLEALPRDKWPWVIFTTAHSKHALRAFEAQALDYLQKPFDQKRFDEAIGRLRNRLAETKEVELARQMRQMLKPDEHTHTVDERSNGPWMDRLSVKERGRIVFITLGDVDYLEAAGNYVEMHMGNKTYLTYETMGRMETKLDPSIFLRIHRSQIVNIQRIAELQPYFNGEFIVLLKTGAKLKISRSYRKTAKAALGID